MNIRKVNVIHSSPDFAVIHEGLNPGEQVIVSTIRNPLQGMAVQAGERPATGVVDGTAGGDSTGNGQG